MRFLFNLAATKTNTFRCECKTNLTNGHSYTNGGVVSLTSRFGFAVLRVQLWSQTPDNVVFSLTRFPGTRKSMEKYKREIKSWAQTGRKEK